MKIGDRIVGTHKCSFGGRVGEAGTIDFINDEFFYVEWDDKSYGMNAYFHNRIFEGEFEIISSDSEWDELLVVRL